MTPERAREMLGGLAAGILTPEERQTLFEAALHDQALFNEVADELEFAAFLQSPETRAQLANRIEVEPERRPWWAPRPRWLAVSGVLAASMVVFVAVWHRPGEVPQESVAVRPQFTSPAPPTTAYEMKEPAPAASKAAPRAKMAATAKSTSAAKPKPASVEESVAQPEKRPESRDQVQSEQTVARPRFAPSARAAAPMIPPAVPPAPPPPPERPQAENMATASLIGTVHDLSGMPVAGATIDILNTSTNATTHATADANGRFVATPLPQGGPYTVTAAAPGFAKEQQSGITLAENQPAQVDLPLQPGAVSQTVTVTGLMPLLPSSQKDLRQNLTQVAVLDFANTNGQNQSGAQAADLLSSQLGNSGQVRVIDRDKVQQAAQSQNANGRPPSAQDAAALGRSIGADAVIMGNISTTGVIGGLAGVSMARKTAPDVSVTAQIIDTKQAKPPVTVSARGVSMQVAANELGNQIQSRLAKPAEGKVTHLSGDIVSVEFAEAPVLQIGAHCDVIRGMRKIGEIVITSMNGQYAVGKFSGTGRPRAGDRVTSSR